MTGDNHPRIIVRSHHATERMQPYELPWACISITDPNSQPADVPINKHCVGILRLEFDDVVKPVFGCDNPYTLFSAEHARQVLAFAKKVWPKVKFLHIHCWAGISRSAAVAAALSKIYTGSDGIFVMDGGPGDNGTFHPNGLVYNTIINVNSE